MRVNVDMISVSVSVATVTVSRPGGTLLELVVGLFVKIFVIGLDRL